MELRESGMPDIVTWNGFFDARDTLMSLNFGTSTGDVVDLCAGYGTFSCAAAALARECDMQRIVHAFDISKEMTGAIRAAAAMRGLPNVRAVRRDICESGTGMPDSSAGYAMLFNILHCEDPLALLDEAFRVLSRGGLLAVTHWVSDRPTPRGPSAEIRPLPSQCASWAVEAGFLPDGGLIDLPPYHFGLVFSRP